MRIMPFRSEAVQGRIGAPDKNGEQGWLSGQYMLGCE